MKSKRDIDPELLAQALEIYQRKSPPKTKPDPKSGFHSDAYVRQFPDLGKLIVPPPQKDSTIGFLTGSPAKPYFEGGLRILAECPEFRLVKYYGPDGPERIETRYDIERLYYKSLTGVNDPEASTTWQQRGALAVALRSLSDFTAANMQALVKIRDEMIVTNEEVQAAREKGYPYTTLTQIAATLGLAIESLWESGNREQTLVEICSLFESGLRGFARSNGLLSDRRRRSGPRPHHAIEAAQRIFCNSRKRPEKSQIPATVEEWQYVRFTGKNSGGKWKDLFLAAGLADLPD
jgi:hypothetical protein